MGEDNGYQLQQTRKQWPLSKPRREEQASIQTHLYMADNTMTTVKPFLTVNNGKKAVEFYTSAFGAIEKKRFEMPGEKLSSVIQIEQAEFYVGDEEPIHGNLSPDQNTHSPVRIILHTSSADELFEKALTLGATQICPMTTEDDWRIGKLKDPFGHIWEIGYTL